MAAGVESVDLVHSHTWYTNLAGHLVKLLHGVPHVMTAHSLEPLRPWKVEQLGAGYALSSFCERTAMESADAIIAVSESMSRDIVHAYPAVDPARLHVIHNGIDPDEYRPDGASDVLERFGVDPDRAYAVFVGRITRQKGIIHLLDAAALLDPGIQLVLCAGAPDTAEIGAEVRERVARLQSARKGVFWIEQMLARREVVQLVSHATGFGWPTTWRHASTNWWPTRTPLPGSAGPEGSGCSSCSPGGPSPRRPSSSIAGWSASSMPTPPPGPTATRPIDAPGADGDAAR